MNDTKTTITTTVTSTEAIIIPASTIDQLAQQQQQQKPAFSGTGGALENSCENTCIPNPPALPHFRKYRPASFKLRTRNWRTTPPGKRTEKSQWWEPELSLRNEEFKTTLIPNPPPLPSFPQRASKWNRCLRTRKWDLSNSELGWSGIDRLTFFTTVQQMEDRRFQWVRQCYLSEKSTLLQRNNGIPIPPPLPSLNFRQQQQQQQLTRTGKLQQKVHAKLRKLRTKTWGRWNAHQQIQEIENRRYAILKDMYLAEKSQNANIQFAGQSNVAQETSFSNASIQSVPSNFPATATSTHVAPIQLSDGPIYTDTSNAGSSGYQQPINSNQARTYETTTVQQTSVPQQYTSTIPQYAPSVPQYTSNKVQAQRASAPIPQSSVFGSSNASNYDSSSAQAQPTVPGTLLTQPNDPAIVGPPSAINQNYAGGTLLPTPAAYQQAPLQQKQQQQQGQSVSFAPNLIQEPAPSYNQNQNYQTSQNGSKVSNTFAKVGNMAKSMRKKKSQRPASQPILYSTTTTQSNTVPVQSTPVSGYTPPTAVISPGSSIAGAYQQQQQQQQQQQLPIQSTQSTQQPFQSTQPISTTTYTTSSLSPTGTSSTTKKPGVLKFRGLMKEKLGHLTHNPKMEMEGKQLENQAVIAKQQQQLDRASTVTGNPTR